MLAGPLALWAGSAKEVMMVFSPQLEANHETLSALSRQFLEFLKQHPQYAGPARFQANPIHDAVGAGQFPLQPWPLFVGGEMLVHLEAASVGVPALIRSIPKRFFQNDPAKMKDFFGTASELLTKMLPLPNNGIEGSLCRGDYIVGPKGVQCIEANFGAMLGGWQSKLREAMYLNSPMFRRFKEWQPFRGSCRDTLAVLMEHIVRDCLKRVALGSRELNLGFALLHSNVSLPISQYMDGIYQRVLAQFETPLNGRFIWFPLKEANQKDSKVFYRGDRIHAILDYTNWSGLEHIVEALETGGVNYYSSPCALSLDDKRNLALLSENCESDHFSEAERQIIRRYVPWTRLLREKTTRFEGERIRLPDLLFQRQEDLIIKKGRSLKGEHVILGKYTAPELWKQKVHEALAEGGWVAQEFTPSHTFLFFDHQSGKCLPHEVVWGMFGFGDLWGGGFLRAAPDGKTQGIINSARGASEGVIFEVGEGPGEAELVAATSGSVA